jgi:hypothetical protein
MSSPQHANNQVSGIVCKYCAGRFLERPEFGGRIFSSFPSPNSGVTLSFSLFSSLNLDLFPKYSGIRLEIPCKAKP